MLNQSISEKIRKHNAEFEKDKIAMSADRVKAERMMAVFTGFDDGGYDPATRTKLRSEGKHLPQFNIVKSKINKIAGTLIKDFLDKDFVPLDSGDIDISRAVKGAYLSDKRHFDYDLSYMESVINGLIHVGIEYMYVDTKFNPIGNLAYKSLNVSNVIIDPNWKTNKSSDIQVVWLVKYLTAKQIDQIYGHSNPRIKQLIEIEELHGMIRDTDDESVMPYSENHSAYGDLHRVVEKHYIEVSGRDVEYVVDESGRGDEEATEDDQDKIKIKRRIYKKTYRIQTSCITLDPEEFLEDKDAELQIERLPFFVWSAQRINGRNCGKVEDIEDSQVTLNKRERLATSIIESAAHGAQLIDPMLFGNDMVTARAAVNEFNRSDAKIFTAPGALAANQTLIREVPKSNFQPEVYQDIVRMKSWVDQLSGHTASMDGIKESSHDNAALMEQRVVQSNIAMTVLYKGLEIYELEKAEAWFAAAQYLYKDSYREFTPAGDGFKDKGEVIAVNDRVYTGDGVQVINDFSKLPPFKVIIKQSKQGESIRAHDRAVAIDARQVVSSPLKQMVLEQTILETLNDSSEQREKLKEISDLELQVEVEKKAFELDNIRFQREQMKQQLQQNDAAMQEQQLQQQAVQQPEQQL